MAEKESPKPTGFCKFWWSIFVEGAKKSREGFGFGIEIFSAAIGIGFIWIVWEHKHRPAFNISSMEEFMNYWFAVSPLFVGLAWFLGHIFWQPYMRYKEQFEKHQAEKQSLQEQFLAQYMAKALQIKELEGKLAEKSEADRLIIKQGMAKELLGYKLLALQNRLHEAREISQILFYGETEDKAWNATSKVFEETEKVIVEYLGIGEAARFSVAAIAPAPNITGFSEKSIRNWQLHINAIIAKKQAVEEIIKKLA